jgi:hypothetical protein
MNRFVLLTGALVAAIATHVEAQNYSDPYAEQQIQQLRDEYSDLVELLYFAADCHVLDVWGRKGNPEFLGGAIYSVVNGHFLRILVAKGIRGLNAPGLYEKAARAGKAKAKSEGCDYWHEHPEAVSEVRDFMARENQLNARPGM